VHLTGVYNFPTMPTLVAARLAGKPVVWSSHGALQRWEGSSHVGRKRAWEAISFLLAPSGLCLHVTSAQEEEETRRRFPRVRVANIPNGVEIPDEVTHVDGAGRLRMLFLGRLDPKKGIENLLLACQRLLSDPGFDWSLTVAGSGAPDYEASLRALAERVGVSSRTTFTGSVESEAKERVFREADVLVMPSHTENFGMVIVEALARGVPVIASTRAPWAEVETVRCGLHVDPAPESLADAIRRIATLPRREMGERGRRWVSSTFDWASVAERTVELYRSMASGTSGGQGS
jgi:glycosyltransferase involved in cell wall biosynthesis